MKLRFSPITRRGILYSRIAPVHMLHGLSTMGQSDLYREVHVQYLSVVYCSRRHLRMPHAPRR